MSYLSSTICDEFIDILASTIQSLIISEVIDSTPDITHINQLTVIIRYCLSDGYVVERFLEFIPIEHHDGKYLFEVLQNVLKSHGTDIVNCRTQSYDNASKMSGIYSGVQVRFREIYSFAEWTPCEANSLNLVGSTAIVSCNSVIRFLELLQSLCSFLSASPQRWTKLTANMKSKSHIIQSLSETGWSTRSDTSKALVKNYSEIRQTMNNIAGSDRQPPAAVHDANSLNKKLDQLDTALMSIIWNDILQKST